MLVFIPGGLVPTDNYKETAAAIQRSTKEVRLWVVIPAVFQKLCIISCSSTSLCGPLHGNVENALSQAAAAGWKRSNDSETLWLAGHSLGGTCANTLFQAYYSKTSRPYAGVILMGSYVDETGPFDLEHYPVPVLTLNTELDGGLARPGKTAVWWKQHETLTTEKGEEFAITQKPVIVLPMLNHSNFCPGFDVKGDLLAEVDQATATQTIGNVVAAFLTEKTIPTKKDEASGLLRERISWTRSLLHPYLLAQEMERATQSADVNNEGKSPLCVRAQRVISGLSAVDESRLVVDDSFHEKSSDLEHCHPNYTVVNDGSLSVFTCSHADYYVDIANTGAITAASEVACKMLSSDRLAQQLKTTVDKTIDCSAVNQFAAEQAKSLAFLSTKERYERSGKKLCFEKDRPTLGNVGPLWVFSDALKLEEQSACLAVSSPVLKTEIDGKIYPGVQYCKVLSPARVLDWMMTDSLKSKATQVHGELTQKVVVI
eukprot:TRINITY_DN380_c0_g1_i3.p1 TRINITY_DN380_c0_g1~~TRINITY_DN380_c0_g1_i3.p1  ORF type:complete len:547 (-),score=97.09 TRINITY_DN380_c0_g1_i3:131-1588(-)